MSVFSKQNIFYMLLVFGVVVACLYYQTNQILPQNTAPSKQKHPQTALDLLEIDTPNYLEYGARLLLQRNFDEKSSFIKKYWTLN